MNESVDNDALVIPNNTFSYVAGLLAFCNDTVIFIQQFRTFHLFTRNIAGVAGINDIDTAQHLTNDNFNMFVIDLHTLQTVNILHFVNNVTSQSLDSPAVAEYLADQPVRQQSFRLC